MTTDSTHKHPLQQPGTIYRPIAVRGYPIIVNEPLQASSIHSGGSADLDPNRSWIDRWPRLAVIFDCETRTDASQRLTAGNAVVLRSDWQRNRHQVLGIICFADEGALSRIEWKIIMAWLAEPFDAVLERLDYQGTRIRLPKSLAVDYQAIGTFRETFYALAYKGRAVVAGFNLGFDLSRLAIRATPTKDGRGFNYTLINHIDSRGRNSTKLKHPRIRIVPIDGRRAIIQFTGTRPRYDGRFVDLKPLGDALTGQRHTLASVCEAFRVGRKTDHDHDGRVTRDLLDYALNDTLITAELYVAAVDEHRTHPIAKAPNEIYSEASIGKAYLEAMSLRLPELVIPPEVACSLEDEYPW